MALRNLVLLQHTVAFTTYILEIVFEGLGFREVIYMYRVLGCTIDKSVVLILHGANPSKKEIASRFLHFFKLEKQN